MLSLDLQVLRESSAEPEDYKYLFSNKTQKSLMEKLSPCASCQNQLAAHRG
jgi:hypothetical protein